VESTSVRRRSAGALCRAGRGLMADVGRIAREHDDAVLAALDRDERERLVDLLSRVAAEGLTRGVHPGYRTLPEA
jgi:hypothetical protein